MSAEPTATDDPVGYFLQDMAYHGRTERTCTYYERALREFEGFLGTQRGVSTLRAATERDCMAWVHGLRAEKAGSTVATYASYLHRFYAYMVDIGAFEANPMALVVEEMDESIGTDPTRREIALDEMRAFVAGIGHPLDRAVVLTLLKTGLRAGELCNLDFRDVNLDVDIDLPAFDAVRPQLHGRPDSIYVSPEPSRNAETNGERRTASNKRQRATVVPVDDELGRTLVRWLAIRPDAASSAEPLFCSTSGQWGRRLTPQMAHHIVERHAESMGWHESGGSAEENVTPHYFRHFFTTHLRDRTGDRGVVKYLRGDVADDIIDTYTHNWGDRVRKRYEENIYQLL